MVVEEPRGSGGVFAYTVTYWVRGKDFPLGAYYNDIPYETRLYFPDSLREYLGQGNQPVLVEAVVDGTTAQHAGLSGGELIIGLDGEPFAGAEDLDRRLLERGHRTARLDLWSPDGMRSVDVSIGQVSETPGALAPGAEALFYREPWATAEYEDFAWISHAFTEAWHSSIAAYEQALADQEAAQREAARMQLLWDLEDEVAQLEKDTQRGYAKRRFGGPIEPMDFSDVLPESPSLGTLYSNASAGWFYSHQGTMANLFGR